MTVRVGILGLGSIGQTHARCVAALWPAFELTAYSSDDEVDPAVAGGAVRVSADELLQGDVDLVVVTTPSDLHGAHTVAAVRHGKAVVVEKPIATTAAAARQAVAAWRQAGVFGSAIAQRRLEPHHQAIKALLDAGRLGRPLLAEVSVCWWRTPDYYAQAPWRAQPPGGGVLMNQALHSVDLLTWLAGPAAAAAAFTGHAVHPIAAEDTAVAAVRMASGAFATITASTATAPGRPATLRLHTDRGSFTLDHAAISEWDFPDVERPAAAADVVSGAGDPAAIGDAGHLAQWRDIAAAWQAGRPPAITLADGLPAVELIDAVYRSSATGAVVEIGGN
ncbi:MAG: Gfo/Idh/MocA family oxidoreductase [Propionibacteriaceae bacterium]|jgi:predicted dehydrogenase|nr:Gfo/Idh/MocA family oxidoreductase [Propionibacteriaceae bacterium]